MPYYIFRISPPRNLQLIETKDRYQEARQLVRNLRKQTGGEDDVTVRMMFAKSPQEAEKLLSMPREERVIGED